MIYTDRENKTWTTPLQPFMQTYEPEQLVLPAPETVRFPVEGEVWESESAGKVTILKPHFPGHGISYAEVATGNSYSRSVKGFLKNYRRVS